MRRCTRLLSFIPVLALCAAAAPLRAQTSDSVRVIAGQGAPSVAIPKLDAVHVVDGLLDEAAWQQAVRLGGFWEYEPQDGVPAEEQTEILVWYSADALHFGIIAHDRQPGSIRATRADRDRIDGDDHIILQLDTFDDKRRAFYFGVNPFGIQTDGVRTEGRGTAGNIFGNVVDASPDYVWQSRGRLFDGGWTAEISIPFKSLTLPASEPQQWGFQVQRVVQRTGRTSTWTDARLATASYLAQSGRLTGIAGFDRGVRIEAQPFVTAGLDRVRDDASGSFRSTDAQDIGINAHASLRGQTLDLTVNPDFSQVEADATRVTANERFALFFDEKRPFFLEGIELFSSPNQLVYTRRIADPIAGAKFTGKQGRFGYGLISAVDEGSGTEPDMLFNIARLRRDFARNSVAGLVITDRSPLGDEPNGASRLVSADVRHVFAELYFVEAQVAHSSQHTAGDDFDGAMWELTLDRTGRLWGFNYSVEGVSANFDAAAGFIPRTDYVSASIFNRLRWYGSSGAPLETFTIFFGPTRFWFYNDATSAKFGSPIEGSESVSFLARLRGGWDLGFNPSRQFFGDISGLVARLNASTPVFQTWNAGISLFTGTVPIFTENVPGTINQVDASVDLRPTRWLRVNGSTAWQQLRREEDGSRYSRAFIPRVRTEVQPTRSLMFRAITEWTAQRGSTAADDARRLNLDLLGSFEPTPGTIAFLGYGTSWGKGQEYIWQPLDLRQREDGLFVKLAYRYRF